jgi:hypothetical protein
VPASHLDVVHGERCLEVEAAKRSLSCDKGIGTEDISRGGLFAQIVIAGFAMIYTY